MDTHTTVIMAMCSQISFSLFAIDRLTKVTILHLSTKWVWTLSGIEIIRMLGEHLTERWILKTRVSFRGLRATFCSAHYLLKGPCNDSRTNNKISQGLGVKRQFLMLVIAHISRYGVMSSPLLANSIE